MILNPHQKSGRFVMTAIEEKIADLEAIAHNPLSTEDEVSDANNDAGVYRAVLTDLAAELKGNPADTPAWIVRGKTITDLITDLKSFEDQSLEVRLAFNGGEDHYPISILTRRDGYAMIEYCGV
jgi:hypothetical protein